MTESPIIIFLGRLHPAMVHFPIALLSLAALLETWQLLRKQSDLHAATPVCLVIGALSAFAASVFGWFLEETTGGGGDVVEIHKWVGLSATAVAALAIFFWWKSDRFGWKLVFRGLLFAVATLIGVTGYLGGELVFGANHLFKGLFGQPEPPAPVVQKDPPPSDGKVDFARDVMPILQEYCYRCHGGDKVKGKVDMHTREALVKSGRGSSKALVPGQPEQSTCYTSLIAEDPNERMPPKKEKQLTKEQIEIIRKWIAEGATWPAGIEMK